LPPGARTRAPPTSSEKTDGYRSSCALDLAPPPADVLQFIWTGYKMGDMLPTQLLGANGVTPVASPSRRPSWHRGRGCWAAGAARNPLACPISSIDPHARGTPSRCQAPERYARQPHPGPNGRFVPRQSLLT
jgi:hypothetical protein